MVRERSSLRRDAHLTGNQHDTAKRQRADPTPASAWNGWTRTGSATWKAGTTRSKGSGSGKPAGPGRLARARTAKGPEEPARPAGPTGTRSAGQGPTRRRLEFRAALTRQDGPARTGPLLQNRLIVPAPWQTSPGWPGNLLHALSTQRVLATRDRWSALAALGVHGKSAGPGFSLRVAASASPRPNAPMSRAAGDLVEDGPHLVQLRPRVGARQARRRQSGNAAA